MSMHLVSALCLVIVASMAVSIQGQPTPKQVLDKFEGQIELLLKKSQPDLYAWHLRSIRALARAQYAELSIEQATYLRRGLKEHEKEYVDYLTTIGKGFEGDCSDPDTYLKNGTRTLVLAFNSDLDGSLQFTMVDLPKDWDPNKGYPLFISLHGTGPDNALAYPSFALGPRDKAPTPSGPAIIGLTPWGRGNRGWRGDSEHDFWEAIKLLHTFAKTDADRWYLTGHSAGGDGSWAIVNHTPDRWAAAGMQSGSMVSCPPSLGLIQNVAYVPFHILIGEKDNLAHRIPDSKEAYQLLKKLGDDTKLVILPGVGHYPLTAEGTEEQKQWMLSHVRKRPNRFSFTVDQAIHPGVWGITVPLNPWENQTMKAPWPSFECVIKGNMIDISTKHIERLSIDLGSNGLHVVGDVVLRINKKVVHHGAVPTKPLSISIK